jgi:hypothetical protein
MKTREEFRRKELNDAMIRSFYEYVKEQAELPILPALDTKLNLNTDRALWRIAIYRSNIRFVESNLLSLPLKLFTLCTGKEVLQWLAFIEDWIADCADNEQFFGSNPVGELFGFQKEVWKEVRDKFRDHFEIAPDSVVAWTYVYNPFVMGGPTTVAKGFNLFTEELPVFDLGSGYFGYFCLSPSGKGIVVEKETGAIVGNSIEKVKEDIRTAERGIMKEQIMTARRTKVITISEKEFWGLYKS